jgi:putative toxin-antitoxin system antitoxin component (TIGR02293 family)
MSTIALALFFPETQKTALELHKLVKPGFKISRLTQLAGRLGLKDEDLALRCGISRPTFHRRRHDRKPLSTAETDVLVRYALLLKQATEVFENEDEAREWLKSPQYGLGGAIPLDLAATTVGFREVEKLLTRIDYGVYA